LQTSLQEQIIFHEIASPYDMITAGTDFSALALIMFFSE